MARNIVLLSDGTGNSAASTRKTNIWRIYQALDLTTDEQIAIYDDGVGTDSFRPLALAGQAFGIGLARNVRDLYGFLSRNYREGDRIYAFGFSRGSFTIRMLVGMVRDQGLTDKNLREDLFQREVLRRWDAYRRRFERRKFRFTRGLNEEERMQARTTVQQDMTNTEGRPAPDFEFVGLWDTVDAYGLPIDELLYGIDLWIYPVSFRDRRLTRKVKCAYHALSIDDERRTFHPVLWDELAEQKDASCPRDRLNQVWFPGVHANVGGGYAKDGLAYVSLEWMFQAPQLKDLKLHQWHLDEVKRQVDLYDDLVDSRAGLAGYYRYDPRKITALCRDDFAGVTIDRPKIHESAFKRVLGRHVAYAPLGVPASYDLVLRNGTVVRREDQKARTSSDGASDSAFFETEAEAAQREERMEAVWNIVWWRRVMYFLTLFSSAYLVALPWLASPAGGSGIIHERLRSLLDPVLSAATAVLPSFVSKTWFPAFLANPILFLAGIAAVAGTMAISLRLKLMIESRAGQIWADRFEGETVPDWARDATKTWFYRFRTNKRLMWWYKAFAREILPTIVTFGAIVLIAWAAVSDWRVFVACLLIALVMAARNVVVRLG